MQDEKATGPLVLECLVGTPLPMRMHAARSKVIREYLRRYPDTGREQHGVGAAPVCCHIFIFYFPLDNVSPSNEKDTGEMVGAGAVAGARHVERWVLTGRARGPAPRTAHRMVCDVMDTRM